MKGLGMRLSLLTIAASFMIAMILSASSGASDIDFLQRSSIVIEKPHIIITNTAANYLEAQQSERVKIWVFFTDKGVFDQAGFESAANRIQMNANTVKRRIKVGFNSAVFADLPVRQDYVDGIVKLGASVRRTSHWLNAASFDIRLEMIDGIAALPFVCRIQPVARFESVGARENPGEGTPAKLVPMGTLTLDYGASLTQVQMINVPVMHNKGHNGKGVVVAMLDSGYRKTHQAFARAYSEDRVLGEYDFVFNDGNTQNEAGDSQDQHNHGTYCWSTLGGWTPGELIGPAYGASFLLAKTEYVPTETPVEEDNWVAGMEWADTLGADVISTSLGYSDWYTYTDMDGNTAVTTVAANTAASLGIVVCNSIGNSGPKPGTLSAPSDAHDILACGAVYSDRTITGFSSRGPTYDGRIKPEVCAMGYGTHCAGGTNDYIYTNKDGTSLSTPLIGGAAALLLSANPTLTPWQVRKALMETASRATTPDNDYGWGIIDVAKAFDWGSNFTADTTIGVEQLTVNFADSSTPPATSWKWYFGDGDSSTTQNPTHIYTSAGGFDVTLIIESVEGTLTRVKEDFIIVTADTLTFADAYAVAGDTAVMSVNLKNSQPLNEIIIPVTYGAPMNLAVVGATLGGRTSSFGPVTELYRNDEVGQIVFSVSASNPESDSLPVGTGEIAKLLFIIDPLANPNDYSDVDSSIIDGHKIELSNPRISYGSVVIPGRVIAEYVVRGDADNSGGINIMDVSYMINYLYKGGPPPVTLRAGDANSSAVLNIMDVTYLINYLYKSGPPPGP